MHTKIKLYAAFYALHTPCHGRAAAVDIQWYGMLVAIGYDLFDVVLAGTVT
jgi:hypothetical protein